ncbi:MAG: DegV family protein [Lachnospiraceae bacterium]|nr:DegV family protein [Lachnospiraceae bacterium]
MKYQIVSDSSMDLSEELAKENNIEVVPFYVSFDSETYQKDREG